MKTICAVLLSAAGLSAAAPVAGSGIALAPLCLLLVAAIVLAARLAGPGEAAEEAPE